MKNYHLDYPQTLLRRVVTIVTMHRQSFSIREDQNEYINELEESRDDLDNQSEVLRHLIDEAQRVGELEDEIDELETENERLKNEKRLILNQREEHNELVRYVEEEKQADILTRIKWILYGRNDD